jgi:hypothetical protein
MDKVRKLFVILALACAGSWLLKMVAIAAYGGFAAEGRLLVEVLWSTGMLTFLLAAALGAVIALPSRSPTWLRAVVGVVTVPIAFVAMDIVDAVAKAAYQSDGWFHDELGLVIVALVMGGLAAHVARGLPGRKVVASHG